MTTELHEMAALYALGLMEARDKPAFEAHLRNCGACREELRDFEKVAGEIGPAMAAEAALDPPAGLRERLMETVRRAPRTPAVVLKDGGIFLALADEIPWRSALPGVDVKPLYVDRERRYGTSLVRLAAGASYPRHKHNDVEEIFVLSGEIELEGVTARAGAYCRAEGDSIHAQAHSATGCTFLVVASLRDELLG